MNKISIAEIDGLLLSIKEIKQSEDLLAINDDTELIFDLVLTNHRPEFISEEYDFRTTDIAVIPTKIKKQHYLILIDNLRKIENKLDPIFNIIKELLSIKKELDDIFVHVLSKRKGEISYFISNILHNLTGDLKTFASFGTGKPELENKPIIGYIDKILEILTPEYTDLLNLWEKTYLKIKYLEESCDLTNLKYIH
jgi:hypothetical protein